MTHGWDEHPGEATLRQATDEALRAFAAIIGPAGDSNREKLTWAESTIEERFGSALAGLEDQIILADNIFIEGWTQLAAKCWTSKSAAIVYVTRRACATARQILALLRAGYSDGALARWRTMNELVCVGILLEQTAGEEIAERYLAQGAINRWKLQEAIDADQNLIAAPPITDEKRAVIRAAYDHAHATYNDVDDKNAWWWAAPGLNEGGRPTFAKVQRDLGIVIPVAMHQAHAEVHGGFGSALSNMDPRTAAFPPIPDGITAPGFNTVWELRNSIRVFCLHWSTCVPSLEAPSCFEAFEIRTAAAKARFHAEIDLDGEFRLNL